VTRPDAQRSRTDHRRSRAADRPRRPRLGLRPAVPPDVPAPARPGVLVAPLRAADLRRARRDPLLARDRARPARGSGGGGGEMTPPSEHVHWWFATGFLILGLLLVAEVVVGPAVWNRRPWRKYLWPGMCFGLGVLMWPVMAFFTNSTIHMVAHGSWAQALMVAGAAELGLARGKLTSPRWHLLVALGLAVSGSAFLLHEQNPWLFQRSAFLHHTLGWTVIVGSLFPL